MVVRMDSQCTVDTSRLSSYKLCDIRILLLRHDTASGAVCVIDLHKTVFIGIPDNDFLAETAQMHHDRGQWQINSSIR